MCSIIPTTHNSDSPLLRRPIFPTMQNRTPQIHGLTRCIQQDVPSVRLILTGHGLDRMFWKGKGAFILGCTSPIKAIMIDRPGMGKVNEQGNCLSIFRAFSILLHVHCAPFLSFSTIYVLLQFLTLLASMRVAIFHHFVFLVLLPVYTFFLHSSFLVPLCSVHNFFFNF
jgi:hypothetical protein